MLQQSAPAPTILTQQGLNLGSTPLLTASGNLIGAAQPVCSLSGLSSLSSPSAINTTVIGINSFSFLCSTDVFTKNRIHQFLTNQISIVRLFVEIFFIRTVSIRENQEFGNRIWFFVKAFWAPQHMFQEKTNSGFMTIQVKSMMLVYLLMFILFSSSNIQFYEFRISISPI